MQDMRSFNGFEPSFAAVATHQESLVQALTDAQFSQNVFDAELYAAAAQHQVLNTFPQPFGAQEVYKPDGVVLDATWQRFVEQLGF